MKNNANYEIIELSTEEMREINGGFIGLALALAGVLIAGFMAGYEIGKDAAARDKAR